MLFSCLAEEGETITPVVQTPQPEPEKVTVQYTLTVSASSGGSVTDGGTFDEGTEVTVTATPNEGYRFTGWEGNSSSSGSLTVTLNSNETYQALFELIPVYTLTVTSSEGGTVSSEGGTYDEETEVTITATADEGYELIGWEGSDETASELTISIFTNLSLSPIFQTTQTDTSTAYNTALTPFTNTDTGFGIFTKKVVVFDIPLYGTNQVDDAKLSHAANVMAQYLDNDEDGTPDNPFVVEALKSNNGFMLVWKNESDLDIFESFENEEAGQDLGADETIPEWHTNGQTGQFDATLEEVLHLITHTGYHNAYPNVFGEVIGSEIANAMDIARGGQFTNIPSSYPDGAWYTYDDDSCDYACQVTEYIFWALTSILEANNNRLNQIDGEWLLNTNAKVRQTDMQAYQLLTDIRYAFPTVLPDGQYQQ
jgi:hypothetical protein